MTFHSAPESFATGNSRTAVQFALFPRNELVVFVHGFGGDPVLTWADFDIYLPFIEEANGVDLVFYSYTSRTSQIEVSAYLLYEFLRDLCTTPTPQAFRTRGRTGYSNPLIVAHSLGAVIARRAFLTAAEKQDPWVSGARLVLFAPADRGTDIPALASCVGGPLDIGRLLYTWRRYQWPALRDLEDAQVVVRLRADTDDAISRGVRCVAARAVVFAEEDRVTHSSRFCSDPHLGEDGCFVARGRDHETVCKPDRSYALPIDILRSLL